MKNVWDLNTIILPGLALYPRIHRRARLAVGLDDAGGGRGLQGAVDVWHRLPEGMAPGRALRPGSPTRTDIMEGGVAEVPLQDKALECIRLPPKQYGTA